MRRCHGADISLVEIFEYCHRERGAFLWVCARTYLIKQKKVVARDDIEYADDALHVRGKLGGRA